MYKHACMVEQENNPLSWKSVVLVWEMVVFKYIRASACHFNVHIIPKRCMNTRWKNYIGLGDSYFHISQPVVVHFHIHIIPKCMHDKIATT